MREVRIMINDNNFGKFSTYSPEMLVYYHALAPELQNAVMANSHIPSTLEELAHIASNCEESENLHSENPFPLA